MYKNDRVIKNTYETTCSKCHRKFQTRKYIHRIEFRELDLDTFQPWSTLAIDVCFKCMNEVKEFVFGKDEEDTFLDEKEEHKDETEKLEQVINVFYREHKPNEE